ncbi:MAG: hypothetical protein ACOCZK_02395 [Planctomycetota bacterium]
MAQDQKSQKTDDDTRGGPRGGLRRFLLVVALLLIAWGGSYVPLSLLGAYEPVHSGQARLPKGKPLLDREIWQPRWLSLVFHQRQNGTTALRDEGSPDGAATDIGGRIYMPLIMLDRWLFHPDRDHDRF